MKSTLWVAAYKDDGRTSVADETTKRFVEVDPYEHDEQLMPGLMEVSANLVVVLPLLPIFADQLCAPALRSHEGFLVCTTRTRPLQCQS